MTSQILSRYAEILSAIKSRHAKNNSLIIAIDGRGGAGKSSLARSLIASIPGAAHIEFDWFHLPKDQVTPEVRFDHNRLLKEVIEPYKQGIRSFRLNRYNWGFLSGIPDGYHPEPIIIDSPTSIVIEGCETLHHELFPHFGLRIWVDTDAAESKRRGIKRDIDEYKLDPDKVHSLWEEWTTREERSLLLDERRGRADVIFAAPNSIVL